MISDETTQEFLDAVPHAKYVDVSDAGHMVAGDKNDIFSQAVIEFPGRYQDNSAGRLGRLRFCVAAPSFLRKQESRPAVHPERSEVEGLPASGCRIRSGMTRAY